MGRWWYSIETATRCYLLARCDFDGVCDFQWEEVIVMATEKELSELAQDIMTASVRAEILDRRDVIDCLDQAFEIVVREVRRMREEGKE